MVAINIIDFLVGVLTKSQARESYTLKLMNVKKSNSMIQAKLVFFTDIHNVLCTVVVYLTALLMLHCPVDVVNITCMSDKLLPSDFTATSLIKHCSATFADVTARPANSSFDSGIISADFKFATISPLLKNLV